VLLIEEGCMMCGLSHQLVPAAVVARQGRETLARELWTPKRTGAQQLGGRASPEWVSGHLCQLCADAVDHVPNRALGPTALLRALVSALCPDAVGKLAYGQLSVEGLIGWGALSVHA
jgi:hypothetical protein